MHTPSVRWSWLLVAMALSLSVATRIQAEDSPNRIDEDATRKSAAHPLSYPRRLLQEQLQGASRIRDYTSVLVKRERIDGELQDYHFIETKVRHEEQLDGKVVTPFAVSMRFLAPKSIRGRHIYYQHGANDGLMVVRTRRPLVGNVTLKLDPDGIAAKRESTIPVTNAGFVNMARSVLEQIDKLMELDPKGEYTRVDYYENAAVDQRACQRIRVTHLRQLPGVEYHIAEFFLDSEYKVPIRVVTYGWPTRTDEKPELLSEFNYTQLKINVGLEEADFPPQLAFPAESP